MQQLRRNHDLSGAYRISFLCLVMFCSEIGLAQPPVPASPTPAATSLDSWERLFSSEDCWLNDDRPLLSCLKKQPLADDWTYSLGSEVRYRYMDEQNRLRPQGTTRDTYNLWRVTPYFEVGNKWITGYVQAIDASIFDNDIPRTVIDENRADLLQYYVDANLWGEPGEGMLRFRAGRQFLKYGSQYLVSPLGWANTYRNFEGFRLYWTDPLWDVDVFSVRPVNGAAIATQFRPTSHDIPDKSVIFSGVYASRKQVLRGAVDGYWLWNREDQALAGKHDGDRHTFGVRYWGTQTLPHALPVPTAWTWDTEAGIQIGNDNFVTARQHDVVAGFAAASGVLTMTKVPWTPALKGVFWWGSGDNDPGRGTIHTVSTLYPFGHAYWGLIDNFNGSNLVQYGLHATVKPHKKLTMLAAWNLFEKSNAGDFIFNISGAPVGGPSASRYLGHELDLIGTYAVNLNLEVQLGYSWFWYGPAVEQQPLLARGDAHQAYIMTTWGF